MSAHTDRATPHVAVLAVLAGLCLPAWAQPEVTNGGFEADRFTAYPGTANANGRRITGWTYRGNAGVNPVYSKENGTVSPFADNARIPQKRQVLFIQNEGAVSQKVPGFSKGKRYRVQFRENARAFNRSGTLPKLTVRLGVKTIVSAHTVAPVCAADRRDLPYARVVSDLFVPERDGEYELVFETLNTGGVSILIDDVRILEVTN